MEEDILTLEPAYKLNSERAVFVGTFLGGPLVAGFLVSENYRRLGKGKEAGITWVGAIVSSIAVVAGSFLVPGIDKVPRIIIPLSYALIAQFLAQRLQGRDIKDHVQKGGKLYSVWRAAGIGALVAAVLLLIAFFAADLFFLARQPV